MSWLKACIRQHAVVSTPCWPPQCSTARLLRSMWWPGPQAFSFLLLECSCRSACAAAPALIRAICATPKHADTSQPCCSQ